MSRAEDLGLRVIRTWAFNHNLPGLTSAAAAAATAATAAAASSSNGTSSPAPPSPSSSSSSAPLYWNETEFAALDFVVARAEAHGLRLVLALGNLWPSFVGPEHFLRAALEAEGNGGAMAGTTIADFYSHPGTRALYRQHIAAVTGRVNTFTGRKYCDSPSIMLWDVINEPRCPGCNPSQLSAYSSWLSEMSSLTAAAAPRQLVAIGTEGFFADADHGEGMPSFAPYNPGAGSVCEGEDWVAASQLPDLHVALIHTYWRQTEGVPSTGWSRMTFEQYLPWYLQYTALHTQLAGRLGKPLLQEEFSIISGPFTAAQRKRLFVAALAQLVASAEAGGPYAGAMWWSGALGGSNDDGYNVYLDQSFTRTSPEDRAAMQAAAAVAAAATKTTAVVVDGLISNTTTAVITVTTAAGSGSGLGNDATANSGTPAVRQQQLQVYKSSADGGGGSGDGGGARRLLQTRSSAGVSSAAGQRGQARRGSITSSGGGGGGGGAGGGPGRDLLQVEVLDDFRRFGPRLACAELRAHSWQPILPPPLGASSSSSSPSSPSSPSPSKDLPFLPPNLPVQLAAAEGRDLLDIIAEAAQRLNAVSGK